MRFLLSLFLGIFFSFLLFAEISIEDFINLDESESEENEYTEILSQLSQNPISLKAASKEDLENLFWLTAEQKVSLYKLIRAQKISYQILTDYGFTSEEIKILKNYTFIRASYPFHLSQRIRSSFQEKYEETPSSTAFYQRILGSVQNFDFCFLNQKDAGEKEITNFYSYFLSYQTPGIIQKAVIGRYRLAFGQGLLMSSKLGVSKGSASTTIPAKHQFSLRGYTSSYEIWFWEGGAAHISWKNLSFLPFFSKSNYAASLSDGKISSFNESGIYQPNQTYIDETLSGSYLRWEKYQFALGATFLRNSFSKPFLDEKKAQEYFGMATDWHYSGETFTFAGEIANADQKTAFLSYLKWGDSNIKHLILIRNYPAYFPTWHGKPFSSQSTFDNEKGIYYGLETKIHQFKINAYFDVWRYPETRYFEKMPTVASEEFLQIETKSKTQKWTFSVNHKNKEKYKTLEDESKIRNFQRTVLRTDWWHYFDNISLKTRFEYASEYYQDEKVFQKGTLISQLVKFHFSNLELAAQIALYHANVLHYMYEYSMDGQMENAVLSGDGIYSYLLVKYLIIKNLKIQFKISDRWNEKNYLKAGLQIEYLL